MKLNTHKAGLVGAGLFVAFFALCMAWAFVISDSVLATLHLNLLQIAYPGFNFSIVGVLIGIVESVVYGYLFGIFFAWLCKTCCVNNQN